MYSLNTKNKLNKKIGIISFEDGFLMGSKNRAYKIGDSKIRNIIIYNKNIAHSVVSEKVMKLYNKLIAYLTELLLDDSETGEGMREALNQIEKFRLEIKIKYRKYLKKKELEAMSKKLIKMQKIANEKLLEIHNSYLDMLSNKRSR